MKNIILGITLITGLIWANELKPLYNYDQALKEAKDLNKTIMVMMSIDDCITCDYMKDIVFEREHVLSYLNNHYITVIKEVNKDTYPDRFATIDAPTFFFIDPMTQKDVNDKVVGGLNPENFLALLKKIQHEDLNTTTVQNK